MKENFPGEQRSPDSDCRVVGASVGRAIGLASFLVRLPSVAWTRVVVAVLMLPVVLCGWRLAPDNAVASGGDDDSGTGGPKGMNWRDAT